MTSWAHQNNNKGKLKPWSSKGLMLGRGEWNVTGLAQCINHTVGKMSLRLACRFLCRWRTTASRSITSRTFGWYMKLLTWLEIHRKSTFLCFSLNLHWHGFHRKFFYIWSKYIQLNETLLPEREVAVLVFWQAIALFNGCKTGLRFTYEYCRGRQSHNWQALVPREPCNFLPLYIRETDLIVGLVLVSVSFPFVHSWSSWSKPCSISILEHCCLSFWPLVGMVYSWSWLPDGSPNCAFSIWNNVEDDDGLVFLLFSTMPMLEAAKWWLNLSDLYPQPSSMKRGVM